MMIEKATPMVQIKAEDFKRLMAVVTAAREGIDLVKSGFNPLIALEIIAQAVEAYETAENDREGESDE